MSFAGERYVCANPECRRSYPLAPGAIPVFIDEETSLFSTQSFLDARPTFFHPLGRVASLLRMFVPDIGANLRSRSNYRNLKELLLRRGGAPRVLVLGGSILGHGMEALDSPEIELIETDVALGPRTRMICDAHSIPFADGSFDGVVA
ncbi:MAG TPA: methyltransferase type 11, partial [Thermoanaerobaculia bacterium]|nr:methyltransferase type 11 [Thermoanaerobaculia bacterium]